MGRMTKVLSYTATDATGAVVKHDTGGVTTKTSDHASPAGVDSPPLPGDLGVAVSVSRTGGYVLVAYIDPSQAGVAVPGEHRAYARNAQGEQVIESHLRGDGSGTLSNALASVTLTAAGGLNIDTTTAVNINGFIIGPDGAASSPVGLTAPSVVAGGVEQAGHVHLSSAPGVPSGVAMLPPPPEL